MFSDIREEPKVLEKNDVLWSFPKESHLFNTNSKFSLFFMTAFESEKTNPKIFTSGANPDELHNLSVGFAWSGFMFLVSSYITRSQGSFW